MLDIRARPESAKRPWWDRDALAAACAALGLAYEHRPASSPDGAAPGDQVVVLGLREEAAQDADRYALLDALHGRGWTVVHLALADDARLREVPHEELKAELAARAEHFRAVFPGSPAVRYPEVALDAVASLQAPRSVCLPGGARLTFVPRFAPPGEGASGGLWAAVAAAGLERPRRRVRLPTGDWQEYREEKEEVWLSDAYHRRDDRRVSAAPAHARAAPVPAPVRALLDAARDHGGAFKDTIE